MPAQTDPKVLQLLARGTVIPAHPLALNANRRLDERRQRALTRYYIAAGAGGLAVGVHTTQFAIREPHIGLFQPVLKLAAEEMERADRNRSVPLLRIGGICGKTSQAVREAGLLVDLRYHAGLLSVAALKDATDSDLLAHCHSVAQVLPIVGFYLQPAVGGRVLSYRFWREFAEIENVVAIKIAPFNRYQTLEVVRAVAESGRDIALYTGNDDNIVMDLLTPYVFQRNGKTIERRIVGGLLGHWSVWTQKAAQLLEECHAAAQAQTVISAGLLRKSVEVTDSNAAFFDAANHFSGCIAGLHEVLRRQGLLEGIWCLDPKEILSPGQSEEISRVYAAYPHLSDDDFVRENLDSWLTP
jgi:dihydrodipicolinate synthase/N-acetylneuraminate lyase